MDHPAHGPVSALTASERLAAATALDAQIRALHQRRNQDQAQLALRLAELARTRGYVRGLVTPIPFCGAGAVCTSSG